MQTTSESQQSQVADTIIAMERSALDRWGNGDPSGFLEISDKDVVYFDPLQPKRINGIGELRALYESIRGKVRVARYELLEPRVQVVGDAAVLTFNYTSEGFDGSTSRWNCTEVYQRRNNEWRIIQTHWSLTQPKLAGTPGD
jgi:ketosteroid isomerase-like protein